MKDKKQVNWQKKNRCFPHSDTFESFWVKAIGVKDTKRENYALSIIATDDDFVLVGITTLDWSQAVGGLGEDACWTITPIIDSGCDAQGHPLASGMYFCRMQAGDDFSTLQKILSIKWSRSHEQD